MNLGRFSVKNPVFLNILMIALFILGAFSVANMPREQYAEVPFYWINITVPFPGVGAQDIEQLVTIPIEKEMQGLDKLDEIQSTSQEGVSIVSVRFDTDISENKFDKLFQDVNTRFQGADLPDEVLKESIDSFSSNDFTPVIEVVIYGDEDYESLVNYADEIKNEFDSIPEISRVDKIGIRDKFVLINVDQTPLENSSLDINSIVNSIKIKNLNIPGGTISTERKDYLVRTVGESRSISDFQAIPLKEGVKIRDLAEVKYSFKSGINSRFNSKESIKLRINKIPRGNSVKIAERVKEITDRWENKLPKGVNIETLNDSTIEIKSSLDILLTNALLGLLFLIIILFAFIGLRNALITSLGIPLTFAITFIILDLMGETFNSNTLFGLVLVLGLIVDHAIVIIENSYRLQQDGLKRREAAIKGVNQVVLPVIAATGTTVAAFLPLMILPGTIGKFLRVIPLTVSVALIASTFEALLFLPSHYFDWPGTTESSRKMDLFKTVKKGYSTLINSLYRFKKLTIGLSVLVMVLILSLTAVLEQDLFNAEDFSVFYIDIEMPPGTTQSKTEKLVNRYEEKLIPLIGNGEIVSVSSSIGFISSQSGNRGKGNIAQILVDLKDKGRDRSISQIMGEIKEETDLITGPENVFYRKAVNGPPQDPPVSYRLNGDSLEGLKEVSTFITNRLKEKPDLLNINSDFEGGTSELKVLVDQERANKYGLSILSIGQFIKAVIEGVTATTYVEDNKSIDVIVKINHENKIDFNELNQLFIPAPGGIRIPFSAVAKITEGDGIGKINRVDGKRVVTISSDAFSKDNLDIINREIEEEVKNRFSSKYPDIVLVTEGEFAEFNTLLIQILRIFLIGLFLIYLILGTQFRSYIQPFLILLSIPMSFAGVVLYLIISGTPFSTTVLYAGVALAGIAVNDAIVLISFINELRSKEIKVKDAVITAAETRLRPILLTSLTTIAGLLPTAIGIGGKSVVWQPMANTIIFGLLFSTLTALIIIPCLYGSLFDKDNKNE